MMTAPIIRVDIPQDVVWHSSRRPESLVYWMPNALAKFVAM